MLETPAGQSAVSAKKKAFPRFQWPEGSENDPQAVERVGKPPRVPVSATPPRTFTPPAAAPEKPNKKGTLPDALHST